MNLYKLTKEQLIAHCKRLQSENAKLRNELDTLSDKYIEMESEGVNEDVFQRLCGNQG